MENKYYFKNLIFGLFMFFICAFYSRSDDNAAVVFIVAGVNALLFPFAKRAVENIVFRYIRKGFLSSGPVLTGAANGGYALVYGFYFAFAIPIGLLFLINLYVKKKAAM
ncbi:MULTISPECIES: Cki family colicin immunity protein [Pseudomonas]|uniref:Cki family colicin immunity protein n=1 Tax=Pseudomonas TaxID=286 RepID=UPI003784FE24